MGDIEIVEWLAIHEARESFWAYRQYINPNMKIGWWQRLICAELQNFYEDLINGLKPQLVIQAPPQHGKTETIIDFITWVAGKNPELKKIYASYGEGLGVDANARAQRIFDSETYSKIFSTRIGKVGASESSKAMRNKSILQYIDNGGSFRNTTVNGSITGKGLDFGIIDDPIKGRKEASSRTVREKTWKWFTSDFYTRFSENAGFLTILTRWHIDDPVGRMIDAFGDDIRIISHSAIAEEDEAYRDKDDPLFPQLKSLEFLLKRKSLLSREEWNSLYQQNPQIIGGEIIKTKDFCFYKELPLLEYRIIYGDTAQKTSERHDYSVMSCWGKSKEGKIYLIDMIRGKWEAPELKRRTIAFWEKHKPTNNNKLGALRHLKIEDKASGTGLIQEIKSSALIPVVGIQRIKDKYTRVQDILGYIESGYVYLPESAQFLNDFLGECEEFTSDDSHMHDDQVDTMIDAIDDMLVNDVINIWGRLA